MFYPTFEEVKELSRSYNIIPISMEVYADMETPISLFKRFAQDGCFLLESVEGGEKWARYSFVGRKPFLTLSSRDGNCVIEQKGVQKRQNGNPVEILRSIMKQYKSANINKLPRFTGGAVGYIGYDIVRFYEDLPLSLEDDLKLPDCEFMLTDEVIVYDHLKQKIQIVVNLHTDEHLERAYITVVDRIKEIYREISDSRWKVNQNAKKLQNQNKETEVKSNVSKEVFCDSVIKAKEYIKNGDIFQVVLSQRFEVQAQEDPLDVYRALRIINPSPYMYYLGFKDFTIIGSSPETLVRVENDCVETCPIAGTRPRGKDQIEDQNLEEELLSDEKELAEHTMLVDLGRNDIGKISKFGTVKVLSPMHIERYSHVMHIVTNVEGTLREDKDAFDALSSIIPAGTVSGAPKVRAMQIIDELEQYKRGPYAGALGYIGFDGTMDMCLTIRTLIFKDGTAYIQAGAGIVADSVPEKEYDETLRKAQALINAIKEAGEII